MIKTMIKKSDYTPVLKVAENVYKVMFDKTDLTEDVYEQDAEGNRTPTGEKKETPYCVVVMEQIHHKPSITEVKNLILGWYNNETDYNILNGFTWKDYPVWLSTENQFNYKASYDLAVQTNGASLPVTVKFGTTDEPQYHTFKEVDEFTDFFTSAMSYIQQTLADGWAKKDAVDFSAYEDLLNQ